MNVFEHIDQYMSGELTGTDLSTFESELSKNAELQKLVADYHTIKKAASGTLQLELLDEVTAVTQKPIKENNQLKLFAYAALILFAIAATTFFLKPAGPSEKEKEEILMAYYQKPFFKGNTRSSEAPTGSSFEDAKALFSLNNFEESRDLLLPLIGNTTDPATLNEMNFWLGHAHFNLKDYKLAKNAFKKSTQSNTECMIEICRVFLKETRSQDLSTKCK